MGRKGGGERGGHLSGAHKPRLRIRSRLKMEQETGVNTGITSVMASQFALRWDEVRLSRTLSASHLLLQNTEHRGKDVGEPPTKLAALNLHHESQGLSSRPAQRCILRAVSTTTTVCYASLQPGSAVADRLIQLCRLKPCEERSEDIAGSSSDLGRRIADKPHDERHQNYVRLGLVGQEEYARRNKYIQYCRSCLPVM